MCTIVILNRVVQDYPIVVAANRDEFYARTAGAPRVIAEGSASSPRIVGGVDLEHGGSWLGVTAGGLIVALTNQRQLEGPDGRRRSRGHVVVEALRCGSAEGVRHYLAGIDPDDYNPFNLLHGDADGLEASYVRPGLAIVSEPVAEGVHVLPNDRLNAGGFPKVARALELARRLPTDWAELRPELVTMLADHREPPLEAIEVPPAHHDSRRTTLPLTRELLRRLGALCVHTEIYGTRSATLIALERGAIGAYWFADGAPCRTPFRDVTQLVTRASTSPTTISASSAPRVKRVLS
jgi:uncharacterized protein with NRDE domain